jgi:hypothetical protein
MIRIDINDLQSGTEYYIEFRYHYIDDRNDNRKRKYKGTFIKNENITIYDGTISVTKTIIKSHFENVIQIQPHSMEIIMNNMIYVEPTNNSYSWTFYQISKPIFDKKSMDRLYENATQITLRNITGDTYFLY